MLDEIIIRTDGSEAANRDRDAVELADISQRSWANVETGQASLRTEPSHTIQADRSRIGQLLENLMRNDIEHGGEDVTVTIGDIDDGFYVQDDGPGIPEEDREQDFEGAHDS